MGEGNPDLQQPSGRRAPPSTAFGAVNLSSTPQRPSPTRLQSENLLSLGPYHPRKFWTLPPNCPRCAETQTPSHRPKTINNSRVHSSAGETGYPNSETLSRTSPNSAAFSSDSGLYFPNSQPGSKTPSVTLSGIPISRPRLRIQCSVPLVPGSL